MLRVSLLGNLGADPEVRYTQKGTQMVSFRVAVNQVRTGPDGERQETTEWFRVRVANRSVEFAQRLTKGNRVLVMGRLDISHFTSKDGEPRVGFDVWADELQAMSQQTGRAFGAESDGEYGEPPEPALAGVSSLQPAASGSASAARPAGPTNGAAGANGNGRSGRGSNRAQPAPAEGAAAEDLEDLPF